MTKIEVVGVEETWKERAKGKIDSAKVWCRNRAEDVRVWISQNGVAIVQSMPAIIATAAGAFKLYKMVKGSAADRHEDRMENVYYDPSTGCRWHLKHEMTNAEQAEFIARKRNGEYTEDILTDMRLLKK